MNALLVKIAKEVALRALKNKRVRNGILITLILLFVAAVGAPMSVGMFAVRVAGLVIEKAISFVKDFAGEKPADMDLLTDKDFYDGSSLLFALENGFTLSSGEEAVLRIRQDDLEYLLNRLKDYNHAGERKRTITVEVRHEYDEEVTGTDEEGNEYTYTEHHIEYEPFQREVDNAQYEGLYPLDFRLVYYLTIISMNIPSETQRFLSGVTAKDRDLKPIEYPEGDGTVPSVYVPREWIDKLFTLITMDYNYQFDVLRDEKDYYTYMESQGVPHAVYTWSEEDSGDISNSSFTMYLPQSYLLSGTSCCSYIKNITSGATLTETQEIFMYSQIADYAKKIDPVYNGDIFNACFKLMGCEDLLERLQGYGDGKTIVGGKKGLGIVAVLSGSGNFGNASFLGVSGLSQSAQVIMEKIFNILLGWGYSKEMAAGVCGNVWQECTFDPGCVTGKYHGLIQWGGGRWDALEALAHSSGKDWTDVDLQMDYLRSELDKSYGARLREYMVRNYGADASPETIDDAEKAADAWAVVVEGCVCPTKAAPCKASCAQAYTDFKVNGEYVLYYWQDLKTRRQHAVSVLEAIAGITSAVEYAFHGTAASGNFEVNHVEGSLPVVYYSQGNPAPWAGLSFSNNGQTMASAACSLTSLAMAVSYVLAKNSGDPYDETKWVTPADMRQTCIDHNYPVHTTLMSRPDMMRKIATEFYGLNFRSLGSPSGAQLVKELKLGYPLIVSVNADAKHDVGTGEAQRWFTDNQHYMVLTGVTPDGNITINNPAFGRQQVNPPSFDPDYISRYLNNGAFRVY